MFEELGAGELVINSIDHDGKMNGYDLKLMESIRQNTTIPLTALGGAGSYDDVKSLINNFSIIGAAAGSIFVFKGKYRAVLINYPKQDEKNRILNIG
jgi:cyclase